MYFIGVFIEGILLLFGKDTALWSRKIERKTYGHYYHLNKKKRYMNKRDWIGFDTANFRKSKKRSQQPQKIILLKCRYKSILLCLKFSLCASSIIRFRPFSHRINGWWNNILRAFSHSVYLRTFRFLVLIYEYQWWYANRYTSVIEWMNGWMKKCKSPNVAHSEVFEYMLILWFYSHFFSHTNQ